MEKLPDMTATELSAALTEPPETTARRLAKLSPLEYDQIREDEAKKMRVRTATLDAEVKKARGKDGEEFSSFLTMVEPCSNPVDGEALLNDLSTQFKKYIVMPSHCADFCALWVMNSYVHDASFHSPILLISSPEKRCGKSTLLSLLETLTNKAVLAANISPAAVYRVIEQWKPTLLIDEADTFLKQNDDMAGVINSGHTKKTATVLRCDGDKNEVKPFSTWCPKVIAGIGSQRGTLEDRSVIISLRRKVESEVVSRFRPDRVDFTGIKSQCARWAEDHFAKVKSSDPETPKGMNDRAADNWAPLLAIADLCRWSERARMAALSLSGGRENDSIDTTLLRDIKEIFNAYSSEKIFSQTLCSRLSAIEDRPWGEWSKGKAITPNKLATRLARFGIKPKDMRQDRQVRKGYEVKAFEDAFRRYLTDSERDNATSQCQQGIETESKRYKEKDVADQNPLKPSDDQGCSGVAFHQGGVGTPKKIRGRL